MFEIIARYWTTRISINVGSLDPMDESSENIYNRKKMLGKKFMAVPDLSVDDMKTTTP